MSDSYTVRAATSGQRALQESISNPRPDLILLDVMMPDMDGYEVNSQLKKDPETKNIPVIFVIAMESIVDEEKGFNLVAVDYIMKPVRPAILMARVKAYLTLKFAILKPGSIFCVPSRKSM